MRYAMIMAGGSGTRLWPMSRQARPKQLMPLRDGLSLLELAAARLNGLVPAQQQYICTSAAFGRQIQQRLPQFDDAHILGEPTGRDTLNAVAWTAAVLHQNDPDAVFAVLTADHIIEPTDTFQRCLQLGYELVEHDRHRFVTFAIRPTYPATGYGYVEPADAIESHPGAMAVNRFIEKPPTAQQAQQLIDAGAAWNGGMFIFHAASLLDAVRRYQPEAATLLQRIIDASASGDAEDGRKALHTLYPQLPRISVDHGLMEPVAQDSASPWTIATVPMDVAWLDIGSWNAFAEAIEPDAAGNRTNCILVSEEAANVLAVSDDPAHTIMTIGCSDITIVHTADATLVTSNDPDHAATLKKLVETLPQHLR